MPPAGRTCRYVCAAAVARPDGSEAVVRGVVEGVVVDAPDFPAMRHFAPSFTRREEFYVLREKPYSREKVRVLAHLQPGGPTDAVAGGVKIAPHLERPWLQGELRGWVGATGGPVDVCTPGHEV